MSRGKEVPEETKIEIARRLKGGEEPEKLSAEYKVSVFSVSKWGRKFAKKAGVKRKVATKPVAPKENTRVSELETENRKLRAAVEFWKSAYDATVTERK